MSTFRILSSLRNALWYRLVLGCALAVSFAASSLWAQTFQSLYDFNCDTGGCLPNVDQLAQGKDGNLYGATSLGGTHCSGTCGTLFKVTPSGTYIDLWEFNGKNGSLPTGLTLASDGNFYGGTFFGGKYGYGILFRFTPPSTLKVLHSFSAGSDGWSATVPPVQGKDGNLYGVTWAGTTYRLTLPGGKYQLLPNSPGQSFSPLLLASDGNLYGTTYSTGTYASGTIFRMSTTGTITTLYNFTGGKDGNGPSGPLIEGSDGKMYGTTGLGGDNGTGEVFQMTLSGTFTPLYSFDGWNDDGYTNNDGANPVGLAVGAYGYFYGVNFHGGAFGDGTLFQITNTGGFTKLFDFTGEGGGVPGAAPYTALWQHTNGSLYGLTEFGSAGSLGEGNFYNFTPRNILLTLIVEGPIFVPPGVAVEILGDDLSHVVQVYFGSVQAQFQLGSDTYLMATVPMNAVDAPISVILETGQQIQTQSAMHILPLITNLDPPRGVVGSEVDIAGGGFASATQLTFGGVPATNFTVIAPNLIQATVPAGARSGKVTVTTPNGSATSKQKFIIR